MNVHPIFRALLWPFSLLFGAIVRVRALCYRAGICRQNRLKGAVISVGNLTVGGTGKTPMVIWLAEHAAAAGHSVGVLTRGYRGQVDSSGENVVSDEVWMMRRRLADKIRLGVGADRVESGLRLEKDGVDWFILDDGFQHLRLARDADIVMMDATDPFGGGLLLPAGRLREPRSALVRADVIVITRGDSAPELEQELRRWTAAPIFYARVELDSIVHVALLKKGQEVPGARNRSFFAFCAIGNGAAFFNALARWGIRAVGQLAFPDHHFFKATDAQEIERRAKEAGAEALICTEKDVFNFRHLQNWSLPIYSCQIRQEMADAERFWKTILGVVEQKRQGSRR